MTRKDMDKGIKQELEEQQHTKVVIDPKKEELPLVGNLPTHSSVVQGVSNHIHFAAGKKKKLIAAVAGD